MSCVQSAVVGTGLLKERARMTATIDTFAEKDPSLKYELVCALFVFFFSSRRRHTRLQGDWSSDVCSSDLRPITGSLSRRCAPTTRSETRPGRRRTAPRQAPGDWARRAASRPPGTACAGRSQIGRAACRERGEISGGAVSLKKKKREEGCIW